MEGELFTAGVGPRRGRRVWLVALCLVAVTLLATAVWVAVDLQRFDQRFADRILPGVTIAGLELTGATLDEALAGVMASHEPQRERRITLRLGDAHWDTTLGELGFDSNAPAQVEAALAVANTLSIWDRMLLRWERRTLDQDFPVTTEVPLPPRRELVRTIAAEAARDPVDAELTWTRDRPSITPEAVGREVDVEATVAALDAAIEDPARRFVEVVARDVAPEVTTAAFSQILFLRQHRHQLDVWIEGRLVRSYTVATGTGRYPTPTGRFEVTLKRFRPTWINPSPDGWGRGMPTRIGPGPDNPLGLRALNWSAPGAIRFHGTADVDSLGRDASHGCVRLSNPDVVELYDLVDEGAVIISTS